MVPEGVKSGRERTGACVAVVIGNTPTNLIGEDDKRVFLRISAPSAGRITISDNPAVILDGGINLAAGAFPIELSVERDGNLVRKRLFAIASAAATQIGL